MCKLLCIYHESESKRKIRSAPIEMLACVQFEHVFETKIMTARARERAKKIQQPTNKKQSPTHAEYCEKKYGICGSSFFRPIDSARSEHYFGSNDFHPEK